MNFGNAARIMALLKKQLKLYNALFYASIIISHFIDLEQNNSDSQLKVIGQFYCKLHAMEDLSRYWSTEYHHNYPWQFVASLYWKRYPNPNSKHVYSEDTIDVKVSSMLQ